MLSKWIGRLVTVRGYEYCGVGVVIDTLNEEYPVVVQFSSPNLHESEQVQNFDESQLRRVF